MYIKTIAVSYARKFNLGDFNSADLSCAMWASIAEGEDEDTCTMLLQDKCREAVREEYRKVIQKTPPAATIKINEVAEQSAGRSPEEYNDRPEDQECAKNANIRFMWAHDWRITPQAP